MDEPVLTPQRVLALRGVDPLGHQLDVAVLCFRGSEGSDLLSEHFEARQQEGLHLYGSQSYTVQRGTNQVVIVPNVIWGGPVTAILLEELAALGVTMTIGFGAAGSLVSPQHVGGLLIARAALCRDGTSHDYTGAETAYPDPDLLRLAVEFSERRGISPTMGTIHTTDALYRETPSRLSQWRSWGADFVNLEAGPFYAVASHLRMRAVYLGLVTDYVASSGKWEDGYWGRENRMDPVIVQVIGDLVEHERESP
jgi:uridine phosphorylase